MKNDLQKSYEQSLPYNERMVFHNCEDRHEWKIYSTKFYLNNLVSSTELKM